MASSKGYLDLSMAIRRCRCSADERKENWTCQPDDEGGLEWHQVKDTWIYQWRSEDVDVPLMNEKRTGHVNLMTKEDWNGIK